jgi:hypothetical protein
MTTVARHIRATPVRTSTETWSLILDLVTEAEDDIRAELKEAGNAASMLIAEEHTKADPIILSGCGPQVRIYTLHGTVAIDGANANEQALTINPTDEWQLYLPASGTDYAVATAAVATSDHIDTYDPTATSARTAGPMAAATSESVAIDLTVLED